MSDLLVEFRNLIKCSILIFSHWFVEPIEHIPSVGVLYYGLPEADIDVSIHHSRSVDFIHFRQVTFSLSFIALCFLLIFNTLLFAGFLFNTIHLVAFHILSISEDFLILHTSLISDIVVLIPLCIYDSLSYSVTRRHKVLYKRTCVSNLVLPKRLCRYSTYVLILINRWSLIYSCVIQQPIH